MSNTPDVPDSIKQVLLEDETRRAIYELVQWRPGLNKNQIADRLDLYFSRVVYHLDRLVDNDLLVEVPGAQGEEILIFHPDQEELWQDPRIRVLFGRDAVREVALYIVEHPRTVSQEIADATDRSLGVVQHHLRTLRTHDLVDGVQDGRRVYYYPREPLAWWYTQVGDRYPPPSNDNGNQANGNEGTKRGNADEV